MADDATDVEDRATLSLNAVGCHELLGEVDEAKRLLRKVALMLPKESELHMDVEFEEGALAMGEGHRKDAVQIFENLSIAYEETLAKPELALFKASVQARLGILHAEEGHSIEALPILAAARHSGIEPAKMSYYMGFCHLDLGEFKTAKDEFVDTLKNSTDADIRWLAHYHLGIVYSRTGEFEKAQHELEESLTAPMDVGTKHRIYEELSKVCRSLGRLAEAAHYMKLAKRVQ